MSEIDPGAALPDATDWEHPEATEAALDATRAELQQAAPNEEPTMPSCITS